MLTKKTLKTFAVAAAALAAVTIGGFGSSAFARGHHSPTPANSLKQTNIANTGVYGAFNGTSTTQGNTVLKGTPVGVTGAISQLNGANTNVGGVCNTTGTTQGNFLRIPARSASTGGTSQTNLSNTNVSGAGNVTNTSQGNVVTPGLHL